MERAMDKNPEGKNALDLIREGLQKAKAAKEDQDAQKATQERMEQMILQQYAQVGQLIGGLPRPSQQILSEDQIEWTWDGLPGVIVSAFYFKKTAEYVIKLEEITDNEIVLNAAEAKDLGAVLISAMSWEQNWRQNAGDFLAGTPTVKPAKPEGVAVMDGDLINIEQNGSKVERKRAPRAPRAPRTPIKKQTKEDWE
jgi:hypothetical protein